MIVKSENNTVVCTGVNSVTSFKIKASAQAFKFLSSGVYTDKFSAIIRELSCNAYDAHVKANKTDVPFQIHLPNTFEPFFSVKDNGTGMAPDIFKRVYTTYFESTKTDSNDEIGCFGIGGKSPYSYVDNYSITNIYNGNKYIYSVFLNTKGEPDVADLSVEPTDEPNGFEVMFAVQEKDFNLFITNTPIVLKYFPVKPIITGAEITFPVNTYKYNGTGWGLIANNDKYAKAIMGNVCYPLDDYSGDDLTDAEKTLLNLNMDIFFPVGSLDVTLSRERLSYDETTRANIKKTLSNILVELRGSLENDIKNCQSLWDAKLLFYEMKRGEYSKFKKILNDYTIKWNDIIIDDNIVPINADHDTYFVYVKNNDYSYGRRSSTKLGKFVSVSSLTANSSVKFFLKDVKTGIRSRLEKYLREVKDNATIVIFNESRKMKLEEFKKALGMSSSAFFENLSSLPMDARSIAQHNYNPKSKVTVLKYEGKSEYTPSSPWIVDAVDLNAGGVYIVMDHYAEVETHSNAHQYIKRCFNYLEAIGMQVPVVYGVKTKAEDQYKYLKNWIPLKIFVNDAMTNYVKNDTNLIDKFIMSNVQTNVNSNIMYLNNVNTIIHGIFKIYIEDLKNTGKYTDVIDFLNIEKTFTDKQTTVFSYLRKHINIDVLDTTNVTKVKTEHYTNLIKNVIETFNTKAPMLKYVSQWEIQEDSVKEYLKSCGLIG